MTSNAADYPYVWRWKGHDTERQRTRICGRQGQPCRIVCRGTMNSCLLEFEDGFQVVTSRNGIRKAEPRQETSMALFYIEQVT